MTILEHIKKKILGLVGLARGTDRTDDERLTFINDEQRLVKSRIQEYNIWYDGDGDELLNYYTHENVVGYNYEPYYSRNKRDYFWSRSASENDVKRTHSGQPRNIVDTLVSIIRFPNINAQPLGESQNKVDSNLKKIIKESGLKELYKQEQLPLTLVEGWGCYKINWDIDESDYPILEYYRAENVDYIYRYGRIKGVIFKDFYIGKNNKRYLLTETRRLEKRNLIIEKELFSVTASGDYIVEENFDAVPELKDIEKYIEIENLGMLWAVPSIFYKETSKKGGYGRSIFTGKIDLFDDLDQVLSQAANSVRKSTVVEYFNSDFLERDTMTGLAKQPHSYDRKYSVYQGQRDANGASNSSDPVQVTQPAINFQQYSDQAISIVMQIIQGIMSPATLGIDISKKDNAEAQREKEKITIFTRNGIIDEETEILKELCRQLLCAYEFMHSGEVSCTEYDISVKFSEFADDSFENKLTVLTKAYDSSAISDEMFMTKLYGDTLSTEDFAKELEWLKEHHTQPRDDGWQGADGDGENLL